MSSAIVEKQELYCQFWSNCCVFLLFFFSLNHFLPLPRLLWMAQLRWDNDNAWYFGVCKSCLASINLIFRDCFAQSIRDQLDEGINLPFCCLYVRMWWLPFILQCPVAADVVSETLDREGGCEVYQLGCHPHFFVIPPWENELLGMSWMSLTSSSLSYSESKLNFLHPISIKNFNNSHSTNRISITMYHKTTWLANC